ncbi:hypothetical protein FHS39_001533 [Streptomyces olivoverticillatus]|uniref:Lipoprotein n=1 Tax=Streptomyces olivoverticillatus TaxID=66427 RepID=A0A7W7LMH8_9ACTN|nr:hypothetical protein [Streptomyces olivoverticillatus]MBB4892522.1 hypothetical protein [Streptomyces olivoverticillatus]
MRAFRHIRGRRAGGAAVAAALTGAAVAALTGCDPVGGINSVTVAVVTGKQASDTLRRDGIGVAWLSCTGKAEKGGDTVDGSPKPVTAVGVDCEGRTSDGKKIIVFGTVTGISGEACVRGQLTGKVDGKTKFSVTVLGDCSKASATATDGTGGEPAPPPASRGSGHPRPSPSCTDKPQGK